MPTSSTLTLRELEKLYFTTYLFLATVVRVCEKDGYVLVDISGSKQWARLNLTSRRDGSGRMKPIKKGTTLRILINSIKHKDGKVFITVRLANRKEQEYTVNTLITPPRVQKKETPKTSTPKAKALKASPKAPKTPHKAPKTSPKAPNAPYKAPKAPWAPRAQAPEFIPKPAPTAKSAMPAPTRSEEALAEELQRLRAQVAAKEKEARMNKMEEEIRELRTRLNSTSA